VKVNRYPNTTDRSLRAWSAADEYLLKQVLEQDVSGKKIISYNDRFGYLNCELHQYNVISVIDYKSQEKAHKLNLESNRLKFSDDKYVNSLSKIDHEIDLALMKVPKSLNMFELYLNQIVSCIKEEGVVYCSFMTRHFTKQLLEIAGKYFKEVEQGLAWKKARVLTLRGKKETSENSIINVLQLNEKETLKQYYGVFSAKEIDLATKFFLENMQIDPKYKRVLDLASGNGVLAYEIRKQIPESELLLVDDFYLAVESGKLNLSNVNTFFHYNDTLEDVEENSLDLVVSNPPFHFEYETNIEVSLRLFKEVSYRLKQGGSFQLVANRHLNYGVHLERMFNKVIKVVQNDKFEIYNCIK